MDHVVNNLFLLQKFFWTIFYTDYIHCKLVLQGRDITPEVLLEKAGLKCVCSQWAIKCSKLTIETLEQCVKYVQI